MRKPLFGPKKILGFLAFVVVVVALGYLFFLDEYTVETSFFYPVGSAEAQVPLLNSPELRLLVADDLFSGKLGTWSSDKSPKAVPAVAPSKAEKDLTNKVKEFSEPTNFAEWLSKELSVSCEPSLGKCTISLSGTDPNFLKSVLSDFARHHQDLAAANPESTGQPRENATSAVDESENLLSLRTVRDHLGEIEYQEKACELALGLMKSGKSVFSGFLPSDYMIGTAPLNTIQSKIVQLEMRKRALSVQYAPGTPEIRSVTDEIAGLRKDMEASVEQHLLFLRERKQELLVKEKMLAKTVTQELGNETRVSSAKRSPFIFTEPTVSRSPLVTRWARQIRRALTYFSAT